MNLRYKGFDQQQNTRAYLFDCKSESGSDFSVVVRVELALFLKYHVGIQEGPTLAAHKLTSSVEPILEGDRELTDADLHLYTTERAAEAVRRAEARKPARYRRPKPRTDLRF